jgi:rfaE bifunctional protein nucleotidyltransferase chain/domain
MYSNPRILTVPQAFVVATRVRKAGKKIATTNGCFDLFHLGHAAILRTTREHGQVTFVGLNSDRSVRSYKDKRRPINSQRERAELLLALPWVDYVVIFHQKTCIPFVAAIKPHVHVNDSGYGFDCIERETVEKGGGKLVIVGKVRCRSTTAIIQAIVKKYRNCR